MLYTTDNGPHQNSWPDAGTTPFRSEKNTNWEGAFRVPCIIRWPGHIQPGSVSNEIVSGLDWLPTFMAAVGDPDITNKLLKGYNVGGKTFKVHLDGYNQLPLEQRTRLIRLIVSFRQRRPGVAIRQRTPFISMSLRRRTTGRLTISLRSKTYRSTASGRSASTMPKATTRKTTSTLTRSTISRPRKAQMDRQRFSLEDATGRLPTASQSCSAGTTPFAYIDHARRFSTVLGSSPRRSRNDTFQKK